MSEEDNNIFIEGGEEEEEDDNNEDKINEQSKVAKDSGLVPKKDGKREPFDSASYYGKKDKGK